MGKKKVGQERRRHTKIERLEKALVKLMFLHEDMGGPGMRIIKDAILPESSFVKAEKVRLAILLEGLDTRHSEWINAITDA